MAEQRVQKRIRLDLPVQVSLVSQDGEVGKPTVGRLYDLSAGGCAFYHYQEIRIGERLQVQIVLNEALIRKFNKPELTARGAVVRSVREEEGYLISVRFLRTVTTNPVD